jgi:hypothetical protein
MSTTAGTEVGSMPRPLVWKWAIRITVAVLMLFLIWLALWSYFGRFLPAHRAFEEKTATQTRLANEVQQLILKWDELDVARTQNRFEQAQAALFDDPRACQLWLEDVRTNSRAMALSVSHRLGRSDPVTHSNLAVTLISAMVQIQPASSPGFSNGPYHRLLGFAKSIEDSSKRADVVELTVTGQSNSVDQASAMFQLWSHAAPPK